jgi:hypothetical protein
MTHSHVSEIFSLARASHASVHECLVEERLVSGEVDCDGEYDEVAREKLGLTEGGKSNFKKIDLETSSGKHGGGGRLVLSVGRV